MEYIEKIKSGRTGPEINTLIRNQRIELRASPEEYDLITNHALNGKYGTLAAYVRETALEGLPIQGTKKTRLAERKKLIRDLGNMGSNLNQLTKTLNQYVLTNIVEEHDPQYILATFIDANLQDIKEELSTIRKALLKKK